MFDHGDFCVDKKTATYESIDLLKEFLNLPKQNVSANFSCISVFHINIRSIRANFNELLVLLDQLSFCIDVIILSEIWINENETSLFNIDNYNMFYNCRNKNKSGGVIVYTKNNLDFVYQSNWDIQSAEGLILFSKNLNLIIIAVYRSHDFSVDFFNSELSILLSTIKFENVLLMGDLNIDILKDNDDNNVYLDNLANFGFCSYLNSPTRESCNSSTCIDHVFVKSKSLYHVETALLKYSLTDHYPIITKLVSLKNNRIKSSFMTKKIDFNKFEHLIPNINEIQNQNINYCYKIFIEELQKLIDISKYNSRHDKNNKAKAWINKDLIILINEKENLYKKYKKYPYDIEIKKLYKQSVKNVKFKIKEAKNRKMFDHEDHSRTRSPKNLF